MTTTEEPDLSGLVLDDRYELVRRLGVGGMGSVYEARHVRIAKPVAIKVLNREYAYKESFRRRFLREAQAASLIRHKNVVAIHDFGHHEDVAYIVMDLLEGRDLHVLIHERTQLPWAEAREILLQAAAALGAAHDRGVIHRDVKPANVFIADDPHDGMVVKVLDFGIARATTVGTDAGTEGPTGSSRVFGTPTYMAPELAFGEPADARSDVYSLGVVAYRTLTGHLPFDGEVPYLVISRHANEPPTPLRRLEPRVPVGVEQVVLKALAKRPDDRFQSMASFARALASIDAQGRGEVPSSLLLETATTATAGPRTEPASRMSRSRRARPVATQAPPEEAPRSEDDDASGSRRAGPSESSDVGTPVTDLGTERLPSRRRITGVSDVVEAHRAGFTALGDTEPPRRPSGELEPASGSMRAAPSGLAPSTSGTIARPWSGLMRGLGLVGLVTVAAAVGAIVARTQEPVAPTTGAVAAAPGEPATRPAAPTEPTEPAPAADGPREPPSGEIEAPEAKAEPTPTTTSPAAKDEGEGPAEPSAPADDATPNTEPRATPPTPRRKPPLTDASVKKKLAREIQRACGAKAAGARVTIEGFITAEGRVTSARVLDAGDARGCIKGLVEAQRFPAGELRTLDLAVTL